MDGFAVSATGLQYAARAAAAVAEQVPTADFAMAIGAVAAALPGGVTAADGEALAAGWAASCAAVAEAITAQSVVVTAAAATYGTVDAVVGAAFAGIRW